MSPAMTFTVPFRLSLEELAPAVTVRVFPETEVAIQESDALADQDGASVDTCTSTLSPSAARTTSRGFTERLYFVSVGVSGSVHPTASARTDRRTNVRK